MNGAISGSVTEQPSGSQRCCDWEQMGFHCSTSCKNMAVFHLSKHILPARSDCVRELFSSVLSLCSCLSLFVQPQLWQSFHLLLFLPVSLLRKR